MNNPNNLTEDNSLKALFRKGLPQIIVIISGILFFFFVYKISTILSLFSRILSVLTPIIMGLAMAYLLNPVMVFFERRFLKAFQKSIKTDTRRKTLSRTLALIISFAIVFLFLYMLGAMVFPLIQENIINLARVLPSEINKAIRWLESQGIHIENYLQVGGASLGDGKESISSGAFSLDGIIGYMLNWVQNDMLPQMSMLLNQVMGLFSVVLNLLVGFVVAIYVLTSKEIFLRQVKKIVYAFASERTAEKVFHIAKQTNRIFGGFISGKVVDSIIIGILCFIGSSLLGIPYAPLVSVIVGVANIIPFFGPYIGVIPSAFLIVLADPVKAIVFIIFACGLQLFDGNVLGPKILGESTGLSPFWIIFAIMLGGGLFGILGMLLGVPTFAVIYYLAKSFVNYLLEKKQIKVE